MIENVRIIAPLELDNIDLPYIVKNRPRIADYVNSLYKPVTLRDKNLNIERIENVDLIDDKIIREVYTEIHSEDLYLHTRNKPFFKKYMSTIYRIIRKIEEAPRRIEIIIHQPPDIWAGRTFLRKCSIFSISTYLAKRLSSRPMILCIDVHFCYGIYNIVMNLREIMNIPTLAICSLSDLDTRIFRSIKKEPWSVLPIPIPPGSRDDVAEQAVDLAIRLVERYDPEILIVPVGLDLYKNDLVGEFMISCDFYYNLGYNILTILESRPIKNIIIIIECASSRESIEKAFTNLVAGLSGIEKPYHDVDNRESNENVRKLARESLVRVRKILVRFWRVRLQRPFPRI